MRRIPDSLWDLCERQAQRSTNRNHRTGCVLFDPATGKVAGKGCAHHAALRLSTRTMHAERHALMNAGPNTQGLWALLTTLTVVDKHARCSRTCAACARALYRAGVEIVVFYERDRAGRWHERRESSEELVLRAPKITEHARHMKIAMA